MVTMDNLMGSYVSKRVHVKMTSTVDENIEYIRNNLTPNEKGQIPQPLYLISVNRIQNNIGYTFLNCESKIPNSIWVSDLYIDDNFRGKGYGTLALKEIEKEAKYKHKRKTLLISVFNNNISAHKLYNKLGFIDWSTSMYKAL